MLTPPSNPKCPSCSKALPLSSTSRCPFCGAPLSSADEQPDLVTIPRDVLGMVLKELQSIREQLNAISGKSSRTARSEDPRVTRIAELEAECAFMNSGERARFIQKKLGLAKTTYYDLRKLAIGDTSSPTSPTYPGTEW